METFLKTAAAVLGLMLIVPAATWAATGSLSRAWEAWKGYLTVMGIIVAAGAGISAIVLVTRL